MAWYEVEYASSNSTRKHSTRENAQAQAELNALLGFGDSTSAKLKPPAPKILSKCRFCEMDPPDHYGQEWGGQSTPRDGCDMMACPPNATGGDAL